MKSVAFISSCPSYWWAGCEYLWSQAALRLLKEGYGVAVNIVDCYPEFPRPLADLKNFGAKISLTSVKAPTLRQKISKILDPTPEEVKWLDRVKADLIIISEGDRGEGWRWMQLCRERGIRYVSLTQACTPWDWPKNTWGYINARKNYENATACFFVAKQNMNDLEMQISARLKDARIVRNPFNVRYDVNLPWHCIEDKIRLACIAAAEPSRKGQDLLVQVLMQEKWRARPLEVSLYCHGGYLHMALKDMKNAHGLNNLFIHEEAVADIESIWARHHALILPSRREGLPLVLVEAMLCARTAIVTDVGGNAEIVKDNVTGFVAAAASKTSIDEALERAWQRRSEWEGIGRLAAQKIREFVTSDPAGAFVQELMPLI